jgi:hypothetical protein
MPKMFAGGRCDHDVMTNVRGGKHKKVSTYKLKKILLLVIYPRQENLSEKNRPIILEKTS